MRRYMVMYEKQDLKRLIEEGRLVKTNSTKRIRYAGRNEDLPVYRIDLKYLYYNDKNGRISTDINEYRDMSGDIDNLSVDEKNELIEKFIYNTDTKRNEKTKRNIKDIGQQKAGVVLADGRIIDGNRRYTCLRQLYRDTQNAKYAYFEAIVLDGLSDKEIKRLELELQQGEDKPLDYNPIEKLVEVYEYIINNGEFSKQEYANSANLTMSEVNLRIDKTNLMLDFLDYIGKPGKFYIARTMQLDGPLQEIRNIKNKLKDDEEKWAKVRVILYYYLKLSPEEDMGKYIRNHLVPVIYSDKFDEFFEKQLLIMEGTKEIIEPDIKIEEIIEFDQTVNVNDQKNKGEQDLKENSNNVAKDIELEKEKEMEQIRKYRAENEKAQTESNTLVKTYESDIRWEASRRKPIEQLSDITNKVSIVDICAISKMSKEEKEEIRENIKNIEKILEEIESVL